MHEDPDVRHSNYATAKGFTIIPNAIMLRSDLSVGAKLTYGYLSHLAWRGKGKDAEAPIATIAADLNVSEPTVRGYIKELSKALVCEGGDPKVWLPLLTVERRGLGLPNLYTINDPHVMPPKKDSFVPSERNPQIPSFREEEELREELPPVTPPSTDLAVHRAILHPANRPTTVSRKPVKDAEYDLAAAVLTAFNDRAGSRYTSQEWISKIISRTREHPDVTYLGHCAIIDAVLGGKRWWDGDPSPSIVYGNAALFERNLHAAAKPPDPNRPLTSDDVRRLARERENTIDADAIEVTANA